MNDAVAINRWTLAINRLQENQLIDKSMNYLIVYFVIDSLIEMNAEQQSWL